MNYAEIYNGATHEGMSRDHLHQSTNVGPAVSAGGRAAAATARYLSAALFLLAVLPVYAQRLSTRRYDVSDGLAHGRVQAIYQDRKGYLWFGTWEGLSRFDGYRFTNYGEIDGLGHMIVNVITEDRQGRLWVGTNGGGVSRLIDDPQEAPSSQAGESAPFAPGRGVRRKFLNFRVGDSSEANQVNAMLFDTHDNLWLATDGGLYAAACRDRDLKFKAIAPRHSIALDMPAFADRHGRLWFGINRELIEVVERGVIKYGRDDSVSRHAVVAMVEDPHGRLLVANEREIFEFIAPPDGRSRGRWRPFPLALAPDQRVAAMVVDAAGALWVGTWNGLIKYRDGKQALYTDAQGLSSNHILSLAEDRDGNLWVGTDGSGVCKLSGELIVSFTQTEGLPGRSVRAVIEDRRGHIYISAGGGGLRKIVKGRAAPVPGSQAGPFRDSTSFQDSRGAWWINTAEGLVRFAGPELELRRGGEFISIDGIPMSKAGIWRFAEDPFGKLWLGCDVGVYRLDQAQKGRAVFERVHVNARRQALVAMLSDRAGAVWLGGHGVLARLMKGKTDFLQPSEGLPEVEARAFFQDSRGWLWIGLRYKGVSVTKDPGAENLRFINYSTRTGLASDSVWSITEDDAGRIYLGTGKGLDQLDPMTGRVRHFNTRDGLAGDHINHCIKDRNGNIWIATIGGLSKFNPRAERKADHPPPIYLSRAHVAGEDLPLAERGALSVSDLEIPYSRNNLLVEYVGLSFRGERTLRYQYKLEGVDRDWGRPTEARSVNYARLAPGSYRFLARAINGEGVMSAEPVAFRFRVLPPFWQRWWFVSLSALGVGLAALAFYRSRVRRIVEIERVRARIATDLHDDIGSSLSQIAILSEVSRQEALAQIASASRDLVDSMSDIVWAIDSRRDRVSDLTQRMREFASDVFTARGIEFSFRAPAGGLDVRLDADLRRQLYLIFKEAVNNAARHSRCTYAEIDFDVAQGRLLLRVRDNGRGFDPDGDAVASRNGNGLASMRERARALGGEIEITSQANLGAAVNLKLTLGPRARLRRRKYLPV